MSVIMLVIAGGMHVNMPADVPLVTDDYVPDSRCANCHADIAHGYPSLGMGRSFTVPSSATRIADVSEAGGQFHHAASNLHYRMWVDEDDRLWMRQYETAFDGQPINAIDVEAHFAVGSGNHARTYLHRTGSGELHELPVTWYAQGGWNMSPGFDRGDHDRFERRIGRECMFCHNAYPDVETGEDRMGRPEAFPATLPEGIGCQRCHGPGRRHVELAYSADATDEAIAASILNPASLNPAAQDEVCLQCHLQPTSRLGSLVRPFDRGDFSYRPGEPLEAYLAHVEFDTGDEASDFEVNHHAFRLRQSECWQGEGSLTCLSCHDPHHKPDPATRIERQRAACLNCHGEPDCGAERVTGTPLAPGADCVSCHMPTRRPSDAIHTTVTDHKIQIPPTDPEALVAPLPESPPPATLTPHLHRGDAQAAPLLGHMARVLSGDNTEASAFAEQLDAEASTSARLLAGEALLEAGQTHAAHALLSELVADSPWVVTGQVNLALIEAQTRGLEPALARLEALVKDTPQSTNSWAQLAVLRWAAGRKADAVAAAAKAAELDNLSHDNLHRLGTFKASTGDLEGATAAFTRAEALAPGTGPNAYNLGLAQWRTGRRTDARRTWVHALRRRPNDAQVTRMAAMSSNLPFADVVGSVPDALALVRHWRTIAPQDADALVLLAAVQRVAGDGPQAAATLQQAADAKADLAAVRLVQAMLLLDAGREADARALHERVSTAINRPDRHTMLREGLLNQARDAFSRP